jgi:hypothetical protein
MTGDRAMAWSAQLVRAHDTLRRQLRRLRNSLGTADVAGEELISHCMAFCAAVATHHVGEDDGMFAELIRVRPGLEPAVVKLVQDHQMIATILDSVRELSMEASGATAPRREAIGRELDGLAAILESHFGYEERAVGGALDGPVRDTGWCKPVFRFAEC